LTQVKVPRARVANLCVMRQIQRILVAVKDPTAEVLPAVAKGAQLARALGAKLELFHAIDVPFNVDYVTRWRAIEDLVRLLRDGDLSVTATVGWDDVAHDAIMHRAARVQADLVVAEWHEGGHFAPWLVHSTTRELLRSSAPAVLFVKNARPYRRPVVLAAVDPARAHAKPAALDEDILQVSVSVSDALCGALHAVHAFRPLPLTLPPEVLTREELIADMEADAAARAQRDFDQLLATTDVPALRRHLVGSQITVAIPAVTRAIDCSMLVMGAMGRRGLQGFFIGNTVERIVDSLDCDLLVVKPVCVSRDSELRQIDWHHVRSTLRARVASRA